MARTGRGHAAGGVTVASRRYLLTFHVIGWKLGPPPQAVEWMLLVFLSG
jgi:hypothetical protein